jgi:hypothetical protein
MDANSGKQKLGNGRWLVAVIVGSALVLSVIAVKYTRHTPGGTFVRPTSVGD